MRKSLKKLLSFVLVIGIMAGSFIFAMPALAESGVVLETNGGTLASTAPIEAGALLPTYEGITKDGAVFGGWFTEAEPNAQKFKAVENTTYYARWIAITEVRENFDSYVDNTMGGVYSQQGAYIVFATLNTSADHAYSGNNSVKFDCGAAKGVGEEWKRSGGFASNAYNFRFSNTGTDGIGFWLETDRELGHVEVLFNWSSPAYKVIDVSAGRHFITIPWEAFGAGYADSNVTFLYIKIKGNWNNPCVAYVDDVFSYTEKSDVPASLELNGGEFVDPNAQYVVGNTLPDADGIVKEGCQFLGWYDNAEFTGSMKEKVEADTTYYAKWAYVVEVENFESTTANNLGWTNWSSGAVSEGGRTSEIALDTDSANAFSGNNSIKMNVLRGRDVQYPDDVDAYRLAKYHKESMRFTEKSDGLYFFINCKTQDVGDQPKNITLDMKQGETIIGTATVPFAQGKQFIMIPWSTFGADFNYAAVTCCTFTIKSMWSYDNLFYLDDMGTYSLTEPTPVKPSYGIATPGAAGLFFAEQSENSGITITDNSAVYSYEEGGPLYTAFRVFGTYTAPDKNGAPDFGKVVVGEGDVREIASRHVMLGYKTEPTIEKNYVMTNAKGDFDKCWSFERNPDGTWKVTYSLLLKDIPEDYAATAFNVKSAIVTKDNTTIYSGEMVEGVSAQAIFDKIEGDKPVWFFN